MRSPSLAPAVALAALVALTSAACAPAAPAGDGAAGPSPSPRVALDLGRPVVQLATPEDFQAGTLAWGVDTARGLGTGGQLSRTPVGDGQAPFPNQVMRSILFDRAGHAGVVAAGHHLLVGGRRSGLVTRDVVVFDPQTQVAFTAASSLEEGRADHGAVAVDGRLYVIGGTATGFPGGLATVSSVEVADVDLKTGLPGPFVRLDGLLPEARADFATAVVDGFVYLVGGVDTAGNERDDILYAPILPDGRLGSFAAASLAIPPPLGPVTGARAAVVDGTVFVVGGQRKDVALDQVFAFRPGAGGDVTAVDPLLTSLGRPRTRPAVAAAAGQLLVYGGEAGAASLGGEAEVAQVARSGPRLVLSTFTESTGLGPIPEGAAATTDGVTVYTSGGQTAVGTSDELTAWRLSPALPLAESAAAVHVGQWRRVLDLGRTLQLRSVAVQGQAAEGGFARLSWRAATSAAAWGPRSTPEVVLGAGAVAGPVPVSVPGAVAASPWFELVLDLDDDGSPSLPATGVELLELTFGPTDVALVAPAAATSGDCTPVALELRDGEGQPFPTAAALPVAVSLPVNPGPAPATLHDGPLCEGGLAGPAVVPANAATAAVWVKGGTAGTLQLRAAPTDATIPPSTAALSVTAGPVAAVAFAPGTPPAAVTSLVPFGAEVRLTDAAGNPAAGTVALSLPPGTTPPGGQLGGTLTATAVAGVATFSGLTLDKVGAYQLRAQVLGAALAATSPTVTVSHGDPAALLFSQVPASAIAAAAMPSPVVVDLVDAAGNLATGAPAAQVTLAIASGPAGGQLAGLVGVGTAGGRATFDALTLSLAGSYVLSAAAPGLPSPALSTAIQVSRLGIDAPANVISGACTAIAFGLRDAAGGPVPAPSAIPVVASLLGGPGPVAPTLHPTSACDTALAGPVTLAAGATSATVWLRGGTAGQVGFRVAPDVAGAGTQGVTIGILPGAPAAIAWTAGSPPAQATSLVPFSPQVLVSDAAGNPVVNAPVAVALDPADLPKGATLGGITSGATGAGGLATFTNLTLDKAGTYRLRASVTGAALTAPGGAVEVVPGAPALLLFAAYPTVVVVNRAFDTAVVVELLDAAGNRCTNAPATAVSLSLQGGAVGAVLGGTATRSTAAGTATFTGLTISQQGTFQLAADAPGLPSASTGNVEVQAQGSANPPVKLAWTVWPASVPLDTCSSEFRVEALDAADQRISPLPADYVTVFVAGSGPDASAVAVFSDPLCATPAASVTIGAAGVASFYVKGALQKVLTVAADATLSGTRRVIQKDFSVGSAPPPPPGPTDPTPLNGWSCGTTAPGGGSPGLLALAGLGVLLRRRRPAPRPGPGRGAGLAAAVAVALGLAAPALAQTAPRPAGPPASTARPKPTAVKAAEIPLPPPPRGLPRTPTAEAGPAPAPAPVAPAAAAAAPRKPRDPRPSVAVLNVEGTLTGERLDLAALTDVLATTVDEAGWFRVVSSRDVTAVLALERQKELLGCSADQACIAELAGALGVEYVLSASVGKVGEAYVVSGRMVEARRGTGVARASTNAGAAGLVRAVRATGRKLLEGFRAGRPEAEQARLVLPARDPGGDEEGGAGPGRLSLRLAAVGGVAPGAEAGAQRSVGAEAGVGWRLGDAWDLTVTGVGGPTVGGRVGVTRALLDGAVRLSAGLRAVAWPGASAYGGGPVVELSIPLGRRAALVGFAAAEGYGADAAQGSWAVLGGAGLQLRP